MTMFNPTINRERLLSIQGRKAVVSSPGMSSTGGSYQHKPYHKDPRRVSAEVLAETATKYERCKCNELGLEPGITMAQLRDLGEGCSDGLAGRPRWICPRLDAVRRRYGK